MRTLRLLSRYDQVFTALDGTQYVYLDHLERSLVLLSDLEEFEERVDYYYETYVEGYEHGLATFYDIFCEQVPAYVHEHDHDETIISALTIFDDEDEEELLEYFGF